MAETPCTCGEGKRIVFYGCAGASNTGQLTNAAAVRLTQQGKGRIGCLAGIGSQQKGFITAARAADEVVALELREELLSPAVIARSNEVLVGGTPIEELVGGRAAATDCPSCSTLVGAPCACRTIRVGDQEFEELPASLIVTAILNAADRL